MFRPTVQNAFRMSNTLGSAPFSKAVVRAMRKLYPESLADKSWDNTGLLLEAPFDPLRRQMNSVLLTVDLTRAVADEAIERKDSVVIAYHPIIFRGLKALTLADTQQRSLLRLAAEGISVYSPHTALDSAPGGINDWLADIVTGQPATVPDHIEAESNAGETGGEEDGFPFEAHPDPFKGKRPTYLLAHHPSTASLHENADLKLNAVEHSREPIKAFDSETHPGAGQGRVVRFKEKQSLSSLIDRIGRGVGNPKGFPIAIPQDKRLEDISIQSVGICAGSGGSLLTPLQDVDLLFTGELSHHEALGAIERGQVVVALFHSNTERGFLHSVLKLQLQEEVAKEWEALRKEEGQQANGQDEDLAEAWDDGYVNIEVSERDRDPYGILIAKTDL